MPCILQCLCLGRSKGHMQSSGRTSRVRCLSTSRDEITARRPRRLRKRRPAIPYKNDLVATEIMHSILDISHRSINTEKKEMWDWDSCSTFEPSVEILNHKESEGLSDDHDISSDSTHAELVIREAYEYDFLFLGHLSTFIPHVLETIEEAVECPSIRGRVEVLGRPRST